MNQKHRRDVTFSLSTKSPLPKGEKMQDVDKQNIIIYNTTDGKASVSLYAQDGNVWMNQEQLAELFATSIPNISMHI